MDVDRLYEDFRNEIAPRIAEGFSLSKDYFEDVSGRLVTYLIVTDALAVVVWVVAACLALLSANILRKKAAALYNKDEYGGDGACVPVYGAAIILAVICGLLALFAIDSVMDLLASIMVPELRVLEYMKGAF